MNKQYIFLLFFILLLFCGCAEAQHLHNLQGPIYGFWGGLWHGMILPYSFVASLINQDIAIYAVNNNGGWYCLGFVIGAGRLIGFFRRKDS